MISRCLLGDPLGLDGAGAPESSTGALASAGALGSADASTGVRSAFLSLEDESVVPPDDENEVSGLASASGAGAVSVGEVEVEVATATAEGIVTGAGWVAMGNGMTGLICWVATASESTMSGGGEYAQQKKRMVVVVFVVMRVRVTVDVFVGTNNNAKGEE